MPRRIVDVVCGSECERTPRGIDLGDLRGASPLGGAAEHAEYATD